MYRPRPATGQLHLGVLYITILPWCHSSCRRLCYDVDKLPLQANSVLLLSSLTTGTASRIALFHTHGTSHRVSPRSLGDEGAYGSRPVSDPACRSGWPGRKTRPRHR
ncbi:hypothetical protein BR93DRAFT_32512 [Coniochaeta sp. PMI_546]|nr:hypothetical protein BR93DRAFT_32512 [Coniochaeta sp. PMI_546]